MAAFSKNGTFKLHPGIQFNHAFGVTITHDAVKNAENGEGY
jgi:hypothetical protein